MKFVYSVPHEGFNDILCQMEIAWSYAQLRGRTFVVDARHSGLSDDFGRYFTSTDRSAILSPTDNLLNHLNGLRVYPPFLRGRIASGMDAVPPPEAAGYSFDFYRDYPEDVLVFHTSGGGFLGVDCLRRLRLRPAVATGVLRALEGLGRGYAAVHVRNTDYRSDYMPFFRSIRSAVAGKTLVVCSDDWACREAARRFFTESQVLTVTDIPDTGGQPIHFLQNDVYRKNLAMLVDLFALAGADKLFLAPLVEGGLEGLSGFSVLAGRLREDRELVRQLLGLAGPENGIT